MPFRFFPNIIRVLLIVALLASAHASAEETPPDRVEFNRHIRPILSNNCFLCHGPDSHARKAGLRLDVREEAIAERDGVHAILPANAEASQLLQRITDTDPAHRMPPSESERSLKPEEFELLRRWIAQGAEYQSHWSYLAPRLTSPPELKNTSWSRNPIDEYILASIEARGLQPSPEADKVTLIRRLSFDLIGLPPSPEEVDAFVNDTSEAAYEKLVDRLLDSDHFGERLAIYWLDLVRYADTVGYHGDQVRGASGYRDYVINAFNANMPFDQFTREQLAGDLLENPTTAQRLASGYNRLNMVTREGGAQDQDYLVRYAADRTRTTASAWLGSSLACAQCHDHKFDPFTTKDFYSFSAFFADIAEKGVQNDRGNEGPFPPFLLFPEEQQAAQLDEISAQLGELQAVLDTPDSSEIENARARHAELLKRREQLEGLIEHSVVTESGEPRMTRILARGNWMDESGEVVTPAVPAFLGALDEAGGLPTRRDLAAWLTSPENPLTARVFVNRIWKLYFGAGISKVLDDLGSQGEWPKHPELLDYLALEFSGHGWDIKRIIRLIVTSATYRQSSATVYSLKEIDPYNRLLARQSRIRLDAELVRDNALKVSGLLSPAIGGRSVRPYQPPGYYRELNFPVREYQPDTGDNLYRRGVYTHWQRTFLHPGLLAFDAPTREECTAERPVSNSPLQALVLLNDPCFVEAARVFAQRIIAEGGGSVSERIAWAYREIFSRAPHDTETRLLADLYAKHLEQFAADPDAAQAFVQIGEKPAPGAISPVVLAAWSSVSRTMLNLHETLYRY